MYKGIYFDCFTLVPEIIDVDFELKYYKTKYIDDIYVRLTKGRVTGYEECKLNKLIDDYLESGVFTCWAANMGTNRSYPRLLIPVSEIIKWLKDNEYIETTYEYGYLKEVTYTNKVKELKE